MLPSEFVALAATRPRDLQVAVGFQDQDLGPTIVAVSVVVYSCCTVFVFARMLFRLRLMKKPTSDDYLIVLALIFGWAGAALAVVAVQDGLGRHIAKLDSEEAKQAVLWSMVGFCLTLLSISLPKMAVVALLVRLMCPSTVHRYLLWSLAVLCFLVLFGHIPIIWTMCDTHSGCRDDYFFLEYSLFAGIYSAFVDICLSAYPAVILFKLRMKRRKKVGLGIALGIGSLDSIFAVLRTTSMYGMASRDITFDSSMLTIWGSIEGSMVIIAACIPSVLPLLDLFTRVFGRKATPPARPYRPSRHITRIWISSGIAGGRASPPAQYRAVCPCCASRPGPRDSLPTAGPQPSPKQQDDLGFDWGRHGGAEVGSGGRPDFAKCFGLTDTEEDELMVWNFGRVNVIVRYDEYTITHDEDTPANLPETPAQAHWHVPRTSPATYP